MCWCRLHVIIWIGGLRIHISPKAGYIFIHSLRRDLASIPVCLICRRPELRIARFLRNECSLAQRWFRKSTSALLIRSRLASMCGRLRYVKKFISENILGFWNIDVLGCVYAGQCDGSVLRAMLMDLVACRGCCCSCWSRLFRLASNRWVCLEGVCLVCLFILSF